MDIVIPKVETVDEVICEVRQKIADKTGFELTDAICPIQEADLRIGFEREAYSDKERGTFQIIAVSQTKDSLFEIYLGMISELLKIEKIKRSTADAVFESRHILSDTSVGRKYDCAEKPMFYRDFLAEELDPIACLSMLCDYEDLFVNDGFSGVSFVSEVARSEVRLDVHKTILFFSPHIKLIERMNAFLIKAGIPQRQTVPIVTTLPHIHVGNSRYAEQFDQLVIETNAEMVA